MACNSTHHKSSFGFTLLEILIVVVIVGIMVTAAAPSFRAFYLQSIEKDGVTTLVTTLRTAQNLAIINRVDIKVEFEPDKRRYRIIPDASMLKAYRDEQIPKYARFHYLPEGMAFGELDFTNSEQDDPTIKAKSFYFYPNGSSDGGKILLSGHQLGSTKIEIRKTSGMVEIKDSTK